MYKGPKAETQKRQLLINADTKQLQKNEDGYKSPKERSHWSALSRTTAFHFITILK